MSTERENLIERVKDAFDLTLATSVVSDMMGKLQAGSENHRDLERTERVLFRLYRGLVRCREMAVLEPELCEAADQALKRARAVYQEEIERLVAGVKARGGIP